MIELENIDMKVTGSLLTIVVDLKKDLGQSKSGKSQVIASTKGNAKIPGREELVGLNVFRKNE